MAIRTLVKSTIFGATGVGGYTAPNGASRQGQLTRVAGTVANLADDSSGSTFLVCEVPASAIILPESKIKGDGWGFAQFVLGCEQDPDILLDAATSGLSSSGTAIVAQFGAIWNKPLWEQCGLAADPLKPMRLILTAEADAAGAGSASFDLIFANHV